MAPLGALGLTDPGTVATEIARFVDLPEGQRTFRVHIDPSGDGAGHRLTDNRHPVWRSGSSPTLLRSGRANR